MIITLITLMKPSHQVLSGVCDLDIVSIRNATLECGSRNPNPYAHGSLSDPVADKLPTRHSLPAYCPPITRQLLLMNQF